MNHPLRSVLRFVALLLVAPWSMFAGSAATQRQPDIQELFREIDRADQVELLEGLPHPVFEQDVRQLEEARVQPERIGSELLYREPIDAPAGQIDALVRLTTDPRGLDEAKPLRPLPMNYVTFCGGFHADYALRWRLRGSVVATALVCFGCSEIRYLWREHTVTADYRPERRRELAQAFRPLRRQRPITELFREWEKQRKNQPFKLDPPEKQTLSSGD